MNAVPAGPPVQKWTWIRWLVLVVIVFAIHVALIFMFGSRRTASPAPVKNAPSLALAAESPDGWLALNNATLFALPDRNGFAGLMWLAMPPLPVRHMDWTEPPRYLGLPADGLGGDLNAFVQTNHFSSVHLEFNISPPLATPLEPAGPPPVSGSTVEREGEIARRQMLNTWKLPPWPYADVIAPSVVQVLVDAQGDVISATLLPPENFLGTTPVRDADADQRAVALARTAHFAPLTSVTGGKSGSRTNLAVGRLIFNWQTVPPTTVNTANGGP
jgi:hypothetical protein